MQSLQKSFARHCPLRLRGYMVSAACFACETGLTVVDAARTALAIFPRMRVTRLAAVATLNGQQTSLFPMTNDDCFHFVLRICMFSFRFGKLI
jgi:hypothetical protein